MTQHILTHIQSLVIFVTLLKQTNESLNLTLDWSHYGDNLRMLPHYPQAQTHPRNTLCSVGEISRLLSHLKVQMHIN